MTYYVLEGKVTHNGVTSPIEGAVKTETFHQAAEIFKISVKQQFDLELFDITLKRADRVIFSEFAKKLTYNCMRDLSMQDRLGN